MLSFQIVPPQFSVGETSIVNDLVDIDPLEQTITQTFEVGYKGLFANKLVAAVDVYYTKRKNFIGPLLMETPLVLVPNIQLDLRSAITTGIQNNATLAGTLNAFGVSPEQAAALIVNLAADDLPDGETPVAIVQPGILVSERRSPAGLAAGLEFDLFRPKREQPTEFYAELPIDIVVKGDYHEIGEFVSGIAELPRIVTTHDIKLTRQGEILQMSAVAKTYRALDEGEN